MSQDVPVFMNQADWAEVESALRYAAGAHTDDAKYAANELKERYHRVLSTRCAELAVLVRRRSTPKEQREPVEEPKKELSD